MEEKLEVISKDQPAWDVIGGGITAYNNKMAGDDKGKNLCFVLQSQNGEVVGGIIGSTNWNWLYINLMWIKEEFRQLFLLTWIPSVFRRLNSTKNMATRYLVN